LFQDLAHTGRAHQQVHLKHLYILPSSSNRSAIVHIIAFAMASPTSTSSMVSTSSSTPSNIPLTFGIELEGIFVFHQDKLEEHLKAVFPNATIIKRLNPEQRKSLRQKAYHDQLYQSWALANAGENTMTAEASLPQEAGQIRAYRDEPLHIVRDLLSTTEQGKQILLHNPANHAKPEEYKSWILTSDHSLSGLQGNEKVLAYPDKITCMTIDKWDTYGIELVSPPYLSCDLSKASEDISSLLSAITTPPTSSIMTNRTCGLHVHIGTPSGQSLPLKILQHLSFLLVIYEDEISKLHPYHRRQRTDEIESNKINFASEYPAPNDTIERKVLDEETGEIVTKKFESTFKAVHAIRRILFDEVDATEDPVFQLQLRMGKHRGQIVNFAYLSRENGPQTIEFRQHAGSVDAREINYWVEFCLGLVRLAWRYADGEGECRVKHWNDKVDIADLMEDMGLDENVEEFYLEKVEEYDTDEAPEVADIWIEACEDEFRDMEG